MCFINTRGYSKTCTNEEINSDHSIMIIIMTEHRKWYIQNGDKCSLRNTDFFKNNLTNRWCLLSKPFTNIDSFILHNHLII